MKRIIKLKTFQEIDSYYLPRVWGVDDEIKTLEQEIKMLRKKKERLLYKRSIGRKNLHRKLNKIPDKVIL